MKTWAQGLTRRHAQVQLFFKSPYISETIQIFTPEPYIVFPIKRNRRGEHPAALKLPLLPLFSFQFTNNHVSIFTV